MNLWLDDVRDPAEHGRIGWFWVRTAPEAIAAMQAHVFEAMSLDHDLGLCDDCFGADTDEKVKLVRESLIRNEGTVSYCACPHNGTGYDVVCWMEEHQCWPKEKPLVHSVNPVGAARMRQVIDKAYSTSERP